MYNRYVFRPSNILFSIWCIFSFSGSMLAQGHGHIGGGNHQSWPDSLSARSLSGVVIVDSTMLHPQYYLDVDSDGAADYRLMLGPWWFKPESGALRPSDGESVTVLGAEPGMGGQLGLPGFLVFEINGVKWREPVAVGGHGWNEHEFWDFGRDTVTVTGSILIDSTYFYAAYFLDTDADSIPEYKLGFGPPWYEPENGATRPQAGEQATVFGVTHETLGGFGMLAVYELNEVEWRTFGSPAPWSGAWMPRDHADTLFVHCVNDSASRLEFPSGHMGSGGMGHGGMRWPDSVFVQFWEIYPDSLPGGHEPGHFRGFYIDIHDPQGGGMMGGSMWGGGQWGGRHGRMEFEQEHRAVFGYRDEDIRQNGLDESSVSLHFWDPVSQSWAPAGGAKLDPVANTVTITARRLDTYYALNANQFVTSVDDSPEVPNQLTLLGNYPNPFNPATTIAFELRDAGPIRLDIYNLSGQHLVRLHDGVLPANVHSIAWNGRSEAGHIQASGIYIMMIRSAGIDFTRRMTMLK